MSVKLWRTSTSLAGAALVVISAVSCSDDTYDGSGADSGGDSSSQSNEQPGTPAVSTTSYSFEVQTSNGVALTYTIDLAPALAIQDSDLFGTWSEIAPDAPTSIDCLPNGTTEAVYVGTMTVSNSSGYDPEYFSPQLLGDDPSDGDAFGITYGDGTTECGSLEGGGIYVDLAGTSQWGPYPFFVAVGDAYGPAGFDASELERVDPLTVRDPDNDIQPGSNVTADDGCVYGLGQCVTLTLPN